MPLLPAPTPAARMRDAGLRVTRGRIRVIGLIEKFPHSSALAVHSALADDTTSLQSVHNALAALADAGLLRRIEPAGSATLYELHENDNHHHLVCTSCRRVIDVDCAHGQAPCLTPTLAEGFEVASAEVTFWGRCPACVAERAVAS